MADQTANSGPSEAQDTQGQQYAQNSQYSVAFTSAHTHNGTDSLRIDAGDLVNAHTYGRSYLSGNQGIGTTFNTLVTMDANTYAVGITWDNDSSEFRVQSAGAYLITAALQWSSPPANFSYYTRIYKNGAEIARSTFIPGNFAGFASAQVTDIVTLIANDYIQVYAFQSSGSTVTITGGSQTAWLSMTKI